MKSASRDRLGVFNRSVYTGNSGPESYCAGSTLADMCLYAAVTRAAGLDVGSRNVFAG